MTKKPAAEEDDITLEDETGSANFTKQLKKLREKLSDVEKAKEEYLTGWQRAKADYSNLKAQTERERSEFAGFIKSNVIEDFIPLADSFEMAIADEKAWLAVPENWRKGVEYIYNQLEAILAAHGVAVLNPLGAVFNPEEHESVGVINAATEEEDHRVLEVVKKGYKLNSRIIRPAQVRIGEYRQN